jgi:hypothetical protein
LDSVVAARPIASSITETGQISSGSSSYDFGYGRRRPTSFAEGYPLGVPFERHALSGQEIFTAGCCMRLAPDGFPFSQEKSPENPGFLRRW